MTLFMRFLESSTTANTALVNQAWQTSAADALKIMLLLGVDLEKALGAMLVPNRDDIDWIKGKTKPAFGLLGYPDQLFLTSAQIDPKHASNCTNIFMDVWSYPIRTLAYLEDANLVSSARFEAHANRIAFRDESGFIAALKNRLGNPSVITPLFAVGEHANLAQACAQLLEQFNQRINLHAPRTLDKRNLSLQKIQSFYRAQLQRAKLSHTLMDTLSWNTPHSQVPSLHYYTHHLHRPIKQEHQAHGQQLTGLQYALSAQTGLFAGQQLPYLPPTKNLSIGATQLVKTATIYEAISKLISKVERKLMDPGSKHYFEFIQTINDYSLYVMLWFCMETSCRPHHIPYLNIDEIDDLHGIIKLKDKSPMGGQKYRLSYASPELRAQMRHYADMLEHLALYLQKFGIDFKNEVNACIYLEPAKTPSKNSARLSLKHGLTITVLDAKQFRKLIKTSMGEIAPNFYRKLMTHLLLEGKGTSAISPEHIRHWLGHWTHGTAPTNEFKTTNHLAYIGEIEKPLRKIIQSLGFRPITLKLPRLPSQLELMRTQKQGKLNSNKRSKAVKIK
jgi:integrase